MKRIISVAIALAASATVIAGPASASDTPYNTPGTPVLPKVGSGPWPITRHAGDYGALDVVVVAPRKDYGLRDVIKRIDKRVDELKFHAKLGVRCNDFPKASLCVKVKSGHYGMTNWAGCTTISPQLGLCGLTSLPLHRRTIFLNHSYNWYGHGQAIVGHELLHSLGEVHHQEPGMIGGGWYSMPTAHELGALRAAY